MKVKIKIEETFNATHLLARVGTRYWEDATVNGIEDVAGLLKGASFVTNDVGPTRVLLAV